MWRARGGSGGVLRSLEAGCRRRGRMMLPLPRPPGAAAARLMQTTGAGSRFAGRQRPPAFIAPFSTKPADAQESEAAAEPQAAASEEGPAAATGPSRAEEHVPLFMSPAPRFFRLLAGASLTQIAFWTSYSWLPPEVGGHLGYWGIAASGAFCFIARHFAMHYVWSVDAVSPVAFKFSGHTFWGNQGTERVVQVGTTQMQQTSRYIAFKVKGDTFWHLLDVKEGKFKSDEAREQLTRMFMGLRPEGLEGADGGEAGKGGARRRAAAGGGGRKWQGWKGKK